MEEKEYNLGKNIEYLKCAYGETNLDLAFAIGLNSPNSISNYVNGTRDPQKDVRRKIAKHYRVTEEELMYSDFSNLKFNFNQFLDVDKLNEMSLIYYPIVCTEKAIQDSCFKIAYDAHMRAVEQMKNGRQYTVSDFEICINKYTESYDKNECPEAIANLLWWYLLTEMSVKKQRLLEGIKQLKHKQIKSKELLKFYYLEDCSENSEDNDIDEDTEIDMEEMEDVILQLVNKLKQNVTYVSLADYYIALRYINNCVDNDLTQAMNILIGEEMMLLLVRLENKYAIRYLQSSKKITK